MCTPSNSATPTDQNSDIKSILDEYFDTELEQIHFDNNRKLIRFFCKSMYQHTALLRDIFASGSYVEMRSMKADYCLM